MTTGVYRNILVYGATLFVAVVTLVSGINVVKHINDPFPGFLVNDRLLVSNIGYPEWGGTIAGLQYPDKILELDGHPVDSLDELKAYIWDRPVGTPVNYTLKRKDDVFEVSIPTMKFSILDMIIAGGMTSFLGIVYVFLGLVVYVMKPDQKSGHAFFLLCLFVGLFTITVLDMSWIDTGVIRLYLAAAGIFPAAAIHLSLLFPAPVKFAEQRNWVVWAPYTIGIVLGAAMAVLYPDPLFVVFWQAAVIYLVVSVICLVGMTLRALIRAPSILGKQRAKTVLFGAAIAFPLPALVFGVQMLQGGLQNIPIGLIEVTLIFFPLSIAYAIVKHNLFDVDAYVKRTVGYLIMTVILASGYLGLQSAVRYLLDPVFGDAAEHIYPVLYAIMVVFLFNPVNIRIQSFIDRLFYRKVYDFKEVVQGIENSLASVLDVNGRMTRLVNTIKETLFLDTVGVVVYAGDGTAGNTYFEITTEDAHESFKTKDLRIVSDNPLADLVMQEGKLLTRFDIEELSKYAGQRESYLEQYDNLDASICTPLIHNDKTLGVLFLGDKKSGKFFNKQDIDLVRMLSARGAVAIDNAQLVEQMHKEEEVRSNLARYLSPQIVDRVVSEGVELDLGGQRKEVSVLFSDIRDFTTISETWPPDQLVTILNEYMTEMVAVVFENKGSIDKFVGDAIVAVFGSLVEVENHAQHAVEGALGMLRRLPALNRKWQKEYGVGLKIGAGINSGEVFLGNIGSPDRMEFTVIGDAVNLAARLEGLTKFYRVELVISEFTHRRLKGILCRKLDLVRVKGKNKAVAIYEPICLDRDAGDDLRTEIATYEEALAAYYAQSWDKAEAMFGALNRQYPDYKLYQLYLERIGGLRSVSLAADWDGVFVHTSK
jgi:class 3 adenylate cyclase